MAQSRALPLRHGCVCAGASGQALRDRGAWCNRPESPDPSVVNYWFCRFATYKRATLWMQDLDQRILSGKKTADYVIAGKAHPKDIPGRIDPRYQSLHPRTRM